MSVMPQPDWNQIRDIARRAEEFQRSGKMDREAWRALLSEAFLAANGRPDLTAFLSPYAESVWIQDLRTEETKPAVVIDRSKFPTAHGEYTPKQRRTIDASLAEAEKGPYYGPFKSGAGITAFLKKSQRSAELKPHPK